MTRFFHFSAACLLLASCAHPQKAATPQKSATTENLVDPSILPETIEHQLGEAILTEIIKKNPPLPVSEEFQTYANEIAKNVGSNSHRPSVHYEVMILNSKEPFTVGIPGGKILITREFLNIIKNESEFASVIGNEIAHIAKQHLIHNLMKNFDYHQQLLAGQIEERMVHQAMLELFDLGYEPEFINEADRLGSTYAMHVGYDVLAFKNVLQNLTAYFDKRGRYGEGDLSFDWMSHRVSMNPIFTRKLEKQDRTPFPTAQDRYQDMLKKIKPSTKKKP